MTTFPRIGPAIFCLPVVVLLLTISPARAEHFEIHLTVSSAADTAMAFADTNTPERPQGFKPRPVCKAKAGEELTFQFFFQSNFPHDPIKNVTVRYYIVPQAKVASDKVPGRENAVMQGNFVLDFKPTTGKVGLRQRLTIATPGVYLVRVESENSDSDHEHFSALDLVVE